MAFTFFFRDYPIIESAIDVLVTETVGRSRVRIWDAGCAMGPEPYTLLICLAEKTGKFAFENIHLDATDYNEGENFQSIIESGVYPVGQVCRIPSNLLSRYFNSINYECNKYQVDLKLRKKITFHKHDLLSYIPIGEGYSMIVCKNVLLHFTEEQRANVITMFHHSLAPGGLLVMEHTQKMPDSFKNKFIKAVSDTQIYKKCDTVNSTAR